jgi:hypothetical protein
MGKRLFVGNLPFSTTAEEIRALFAQFGEIADVHIVIDRETSRPRGFGFVSFATDEQAARATEKLNGQMVGGRPLVVKDARDRGAPAPPGERGPRPARPMRDGARPGPPGGAGRPWQPRFPRMPMPDPAEMPAEGERRRFAVKKRRPEGEAERGPKVRLREEEEVRTGHWRQWIEDDDETEEQEELRVTEEPEETPVTEEPEETPVTEEPEEPEEAPVTEEPEDEETEPSGDADDHGRS